MNVLPTFSKDYEDEHEAFAASRSTDFIYEVSDNSLFEALDNHAETIEGEAKLPLVIAGASGCGKSALLANWVSRRRLSKHRDEFLFQHFVGSSPRSKQLTHLLFRLELALKEHFQLREMEVPACEERLRWSLNRFLAAAAKKQYPVRIVIVIDAVNCLRGESSAADTLHWLPTELPQGVRLIVSTVELEETKQSIVEAYGDNFRIHRTYTELRRRRCPRIRIQPLSVEVRHLIIGSFLNRNQRAANFLEQAQQFRLVTAKAASQPLFLRIVLYALRLGCEMSTTSIDSEIDICLAAENAFDLISRFLDRCCDHIVSVSISKEKLPEGTFRVSNEADSHKFSLSVQNSLAHIFTAIYASRHGLSDNEIWGIVELATGEVLAVSDYSYMRRVLQDFTFSVRGLKSFSHEDYVAVVYEKFIRLPEVNIRSHQLLARYFAKLSPCDRKLDALPYHLEVSGSWARLRRALVDVRMFRLWWTPNHKMEFLSLWASLTSENKSTETRNLVTGEFDETMICKQRPRPCVDIVEEYVRSVDQYIASHKACDEELAIVILKIADFMLEFATISLEETADVPSYIHPVVTNVDLASLGVPFLSRDKDGNTILKTPFPESQSKSKHNALDVPMKAHESSPLCSTYYYYRWMWIQFPWVSRANCGSRVSSVLDFVKQEKSLFIGDLRCQLRISKVNEVNRMDRRCSNYGTDPHQISQRTSSNLRVVHSHPKTLTNTFPCIKSHARIILSEKRDIRVGSNPIDKTQTPTKVKRGHSGYAKMRDLYPTSIQGLTDEPTSSHQPFYSLRFEFDSLRQRRVSLEIKLQRKCKNSHDMKKYKASSNEIETRIDFLAREMNCVLRSQSIAKLVFANYRAVCLICERHPAHNQVLINELENRLRQDAQFIASIRHRLRSVFSISQDNAASVKLLKHVNKRRAALHSELLVSQETQDFRPNIKRHQHFLEISERIDTASTPDLNRSNESCALHPAFGDSDVSSVARAHASTIDVAYKIRRISVSWEEHCDLVRKRTFLSDSREFVTKLYNAQSLRKQMAALHDGTEMKLRELKHILNGIDSELEQVRYDSESILGTTSREARELQIRMSQQVTKHKHKREAALSTERLRHAALAGIKHICLMLSVPLPDQDTPVNEIIHQVESVLEALIDEKDRTSQKIDVNHASFRETPHTYDKLTRPSELDSALDRFEMSKALIAHRLPVKREKNGHSIEQRNAYEEGEVFT